MEMKYQVIRSHGTPQILNKIVNLFFNQIQEKNWSQRPATCAAKGLLEGSSAFGKVRMTLLEMQSERRWSDAPSALRHLLLTASLD